MHLYTYHIILSPLSFNKSAPAAKHFSGGINTGNMIVPIWVGLEGVVQSEATWHTLTVFLVNDAVWYSSAGDSTAEMKHNRRNAAYQIRSD